MSLRINVSEPIKLNDKFGSYVSYRVATSGLAMGGDASVNRRYSDFDWFAKELQRHLPGVIVPALPNKSIVGGFSQDFVESRQRGLEKFLQRCAAHGDIASFPLFSQFLQMDEATLKRTIEESKANKPQLSSKAMSFFEGTLNTIQNSGKKAEVEKSAADLQIDEINIYMTALDKQMQLITKHSETLVKRYRESSATTFELGQSFTYLGQNEGENVGQGLIQLGSTTDSVSVMGTMRAETNTLQLLEPMEEYLRLVQSVRSALNQRQEKKNIYIDALTDVEVKQNAYNKLLGQPGKEEQANLKQQAVTQAQARADQLKVEYDQCTEKLLNEFEVFKYQKAVDFRSIIIRFVESQIEYHKKAEEAWTAVLPSLQNIYIANSGQTKRADNSSAGGYNPFHDQDMVGV